jgi:D-alanyl-D-alanine carboxypeptidase (penicillin-binding protein 5/6)
MLKKIVSFMTVIFIFVTLCTPVSAEFKPTLNLKSQGAILVDLDTNTVLFSKNPNERIQPAQLTNIMVALVVLDECEDIEKAKITAGDEAWAELLNWPERDKTYGLIKGGQTLSVKDYLYAMLLSSSIEAACVLGDYFGEGMPKFIIKMNSKAKSLGCDNTNFTNAHGLYDPTAYTTAADMAKITQAALENKDFVDISTTLEYSPNNYESLFWRHSNLMLFEDYKKYYYKGVRGIKTGGLTESGRNIVLTAEIQAGGRSYRYLLVTLGGAYASNDNGIIYNNIADAKIILDWATTHLSMTKVLSTDEHLAELKVLYASTKEDFIELCPAEEYSMLWSNETAVNAIEKRVIIDETTLIAPVKQGTVFGKVELILTDKVIATIPLVANKDVERSNVEFNKKAVFNFTSTKYFKNALTISIVFFIIYSILCIAAIGHFHSEPNKAKQWQKSQKKKHRK